ncbi:YtxH domain-containing protein [Paraclostridium ghonii]|uniref:Gas vesicle protein n=1 Tax=Paraclostridium ghonii TaxID=29358 RepID=A0ABU0N3F4_9FIRM|nr:YtxH domain-containing protein [Paeniclostridium ghonii]MCM0166854.1 YtxH domain-containing protein [Paeniclostridium ghonii]MDQ0557226.1 gas vesicle protein [Paeniclostridium ghonii]
MSRNKGKIFFLGSVLGFLLGLFLAPKKGSELRKEVKDKVEDIKENPKEVLEETIKTVKDKITNIVDDCDVDDINIVEDEIIISKTFEDEGDNV